MALTNEELILLAHETAADHNAKLILFFIVVIYSVFMLYLAKNMKVEHYGQMLVKYLVLKIPAMVFLFHIPLMSLFLLSAVSFETVYIFIISFYSLYYVLIVLAMFFYGWRGFLHFLGIKLKSPSEFMRNGE